MTQPANPPNQCDPIDASGVYDLMGKSPQLALARAMRWPMVPFVIQVVGTFPNTNAQALAPVTGDVVPQQDVIIKSVVFRLVNKNTAAGSFDELRDYFATLQNGIQATCVVQGAPGYSIAPNFTYVSALFDTLGGAWPEGWVIRDGSTVQMAYNSPFALRAAPLDAVTLFRCYQPAGGKFKRLSDTDALSQLSDMGYDTTIGTSCSQCRG